MKAHRSNLATCIRISLLALGYSTVKVVNSVNSELGKIGVRETESKTGASRVTGKGTEYDVSTGTTTKYRGKLTMPLYFDAWCSAIAKVEKVAPFPRDGVIPIPAPFITWMDTFAKADKKTVEAEAAIKTEDPEVSVTIADAQPEVK